MAADDALLFIDANKYLDLYQVVSGKAVLAALSEQAGHIFTTRQVVDEVMRGKTRVMAAFLAKHFGELTFKSYSVPDHLFGSAEKESKDIMTGMRVINERVKQVNEEVSGLARSIMEKVSQSKDEVSITLATIFERALQHTESELQRARERKERGNPPGKQGDPLGDQLSWEQILSRFAKKTKLWIITRDSDYRVVYGGKGFMYRFLYEDLLAVSPNAEVFLFEDIASGIKHFASVTGVPAEKLPTDEQIEEIKNEEKELDPPNVAQASVDAFTGFREVIDRLQFRPATTRHDRIMRGLDFMDLPP